MYNPIKYKDSEGKKGRQVYHPLGSVWDNSNNIMKSRRDKCFQKLQMVVGKNKHYN